MTLSYGNWRERLVVCVPTSRPEQMAGPQRSLWEMGVLGSFPSNKLFSPNLQEPDTSRPHPALPTLEMG